MNEYVREIAGQDFTAKDFRTWAGTVLAIRELRASAPRRNERERKSTLVNAVKPVARQLGNRPATCRKYYIHPAVLESYLTGSLLPALEQGKEQEAAYAGLGLKSEEYCMMVIIAAYQEKLARRARAKAA